MIRQGPRCPCRNARMEEDGREFPVHDDRAKISCNFLDERSRACSRNLSIGSRRIVYIILCEPAHVGTHRRNVCPCCAVEKPGRRDREDYRVRE